MDTVRLEPGCEELTREVTMSKVDVIEVEGVVVEALPNAMFKVKLETITSYWLMSPVKCG